MSNPYELRLDVLKLAKSILDAEQTAKIAQTNPIFSGELSANVVTSNATGCIPLAATHNSYSTDDVIYTANKLYEFVNRKDIR